jgi:hypothetical protein
MCLVQTRLKCGPKEEMACFKWVPSNQADGSSGRIKGNLDAKHQAGGEGRAEEKDAYFLYKYE